MKRTTEFVLGLIGGIFGFIGSLFALFFGGLDAALSSTGESSIIAAGWIALFLAILGIVGAVLVRSKPVLGGAFMLISGIGGIIATFLAYFLGGVLLIIGGIMGIVHREKKQLAT